MHSDETPNEIFKKYNQREYKVFYLAFETNDYIKNKPISIFATSSSRIALKRRVYDYVTSSGGKITRTLVEEYECMLDNLYFVTPTFSYLVQYDGWYDCCVRNDSPIYDLITPEVILNPVLVRKLITNVADLENKLPEILFNHDLANREDAIFDNDFLDGL